MSDTSLGRLATGVVALVGTTALALALLVALAPGLAPVGLLETVLAPLSNNGAWVVFVVGALVVVVAYQFLLGDEATVERPNVRIPTVPSAVESDRSEVDTPGDWVDERLAKVRGDDPVEGRVGLAIVKRRIRERMTEVAVDVITDAESCSRRAAHERLERGTWTDRPRARVFLGGDDVERLPLSVRVRDWASGEAFERQVQATVEELAALAGVDTGESLAPEPATLAVERDDAEAGWQPRRDARDEAFGETLLDSSGLYRREMFDDEGDIADLDLDPAGDAADGSPTPEAASDARIEGEPAVETESESESGPGTDRVETEAGGERA